MPLEVGPLLDDQNNDVGTKGFYRFAGSVGQRYRIAIHEDGTYIALQPGHAVIYSDTFRIGADWKGEYVQTAIYRSGVQTSAYDQAVATLQAQVGRHHAKISWVKPRSP